MPEPKADLRVVAVAPRSMWPWHAALLGALLLAWYGLTRIGVMSPFFFGEPLVVLQRLVDWFVSGKIFLHLGVTLLETLLAFAIGTASGLIIGFWLGLWTLAIRPLDPFIIPGNTHARVV